MKTPVSQAEQDVEEMLQSFRESFAKSRADAGASPPPPPPPVEAVASKPSGGSKWGDLKAGADKAAKPAAPPPIPPPKFHSPPPPATPRPYVPPPAPAATPPAAPKPASPGGGKASKWGSLKEGVKEPTNAIERAQAAEDGEHEGCGD